MATLYAIFFKKKTTQHNTFILKHAKCVCGEERDQEETRFHLAFVVLLRSAKRRIDAQLI